jgi:hypothetical protein
LGTGDFFLQSFMRSLWGPSMNPGLGKMEFAQPLHVDFCTASSTVNFPLPGVLTFVLTSP